MNITSQFFITYYPGSASLDLMAIPETLSSDARLRAEYNRFIDGISTIYGSQQADGSIPVFWTSPDGIGYAPNPDSTLTSLDPKESYYFIVRDESYLPLHIPYMGLLLPGMDDYNVLPIINATGTTILTEDNYAYLEFNVSGLQPYQDYTYKFNGIAANWPVTVSPISGSIRPSDDTFNVDTTLMFCRTSGSCLSSPRLIDYTLDSYINYGNLYAVINLEVIPVADPSDSIQSDFYTVKCDECLPVPKYPNINFSTDTLTLSTACCSGTYPIIATASNIVPSEPYTYTFTSNTGSITFNPASGTIYFGTGLVQNINTIMTTELVQKERGIIKVTLTHDSSNYTSSDYMTISCSPTC